MITPEENSGSEITFINQAKGTQSGEEEASPQGKSPLKLVEHKSGHDVVDVMHAGVDTQDFVELEESDPTLGQ